MANSSMDRDLVAWLRQQLLEANPDLLRELLATMVQELMGAEAQQACGAEYGERSSERSNSRNGYRERDWDTRAGTIPLAIPKLRQGSYFPDWLLEPRRRAERALVTVIAHAYLAGVSTRRVEGLVQTLGVAQISKSQVSAMAKSLDGMVDEFRNRPLDGSPYTYVWLDGLSQRCREGGRVVNVCTAIATGVNVDGHREILGIDVFTSEDGAAWTSFLRGLVARGLSGVRLVISDDHLGLKQAIADSATQAIVIACAGRTFIAGADITEFGKPPADPSLHSVLDLIEGSPKPVVAAIHGTALGGGLEVTLACHYRVGVKDARFGLPEVKLGLLPGAGGTQRLPRVVGVEKALSMMVSGDPIRADEALASGLIDQPVPVPWWNGLPLRLVE